MRNEGCRGEKGKNRHATIQDIARETGFSVATVSRVINKTHVSYSEKTRRIVEEAAMRLNYRPDMMARGLKVGRSFSIALVTPEIDEFYTGIFNGVNDLAIEKGYTVLWFSSQNDPEIERRNFRQIQDRNFDAMIIVTGLFEENSNLSRVIGNLPVVLLEGMHPVEGVSRVYVDVEQSCCDAVKYLVSYGHRRIAYVTAPMDYDTLRYRYQGYLRGLRECGLPNDESLVFCDDALSSCNYAANYHLMRRVLAERSFSAIFIQSDWTSIAALKAAKELSLRVPADLSIVAFDNLPFTDYTDPPLTVVEQDYLRMGRIAMEQALSMIAGDEPRVERLEGRLIVRRSVARNPDRP